MSETKAPAAGPVHFTFDGQTIEASAGQSIAAALYASGQRVFSRSFKYHRPRGLFCLTGDCPNCLMQVDGRPNVRTCIEPVRDGQVVRHQNAWPGLDVDFLGIIDRFDRFLPVGFYYKQFHKPRWVWPIFEHVVRHIAGLGRVDVQKVPHLDTDVEHLHVDVCVIGAGPAGLAAAVEAGQAGAHVLLLERTPTPGGHLLFDGGDLSALNPFLSALQSPRLQLRCDATAFGIYEGNMLAAFEGDRLLKIRARQIIVCTGGRERPLIFHNNDLPGIFLGRGVQRLQRLHGVQAGRRAIVVTDHAGGFRLADDLHAQGVEVAAVIALPGTREGTSANGPTFHGTIVEAHGKSRLRAVTVAEVNPDGSLATKKRIACDVLCMATALAPANELLLQAGVKYEPANGGWRIRQSVPGVWAAGAAAGTVGLAATILEGRLRGLEAASALALPTPTLEECQRQWAESSLASGSRLNGCELPGDSAGQKRFVCLCEDVTVKDIEQAVAEGFDEIETLKRYSTANMGPCQGKVCGVAAMEVCARVSGRQLAQVGHTTSRPPAVPVELGVLAADRSHAVRRTPLHHWHEQAGARWLDAGQWKRPESYGDPFAEVHAIRTNVGIIDVGTLGKIELVGRDAVELLERTYLNRWADLKAGRARYGVMCTEEGIVFDDGIGARVGPEHFYLTASTGNAEAVVRWLELWAATWGLDVTVLNRTSALAAMNVAGPRARDVLRRLTSLDLSTEAFPYPALREADVAGVPCRLLRVGFVGELGFEIHCPACHGEHVWEALVHAGREFGIRPCGIEAQRILRLEKGHFIVGVDTDALSNPLEAGLESMVRFDKPLFHGRDTLLRLKAMGKRSHLVGFVMEEENLVPAEGCQVVEEGRPVGRVTSSRYSPTLERTIGLAWVPISSARPGQRFLIRFQGIDATAITCSLPFYDPEGKRLKG